MYLCTEKLINLNRKNMDFKNKIALLAIKEKLAKEESEKPKFQKPQISEFDKKINFIINKLKNPNIREHLDVVRFYRIQNGLEIVCESMGAVEVKTNEIADAWVKSINDVINTENICQGVQ